MRIRPRLVLTGVAILLAAAAAFALAWPLVLPRFTYYPERLTAEAARPGLWGLDRASEVTIRTADDLALHGWWLPAETSVRPACDAAIIYFHGNAGSLVSRAAIARTLSRRGLDVLLFDYRGYGRSEGEPSESGLRMDAEAALRFLVEEKGIPAGRVVLYGQSLGSALAAGLALEHDVGGLVLGAPFPGLPAAVAHHLPWLPVRLLLWRTGRYEAGTRIGALRVPLLVLLGEEDTLVPPGLTERVFDAAPEPKTLARIDAGHNTLVMHPASWVAVDAFLREHLGCGAD